MGIQSLKTSGINNFVRHKSILAGNLATILPVPVEYLVIAGGGGTVGYNSAGGGGAGGYRSSVTGESSGGGYSAENAFFAIISQSYSITVGAGGAGGLGQFESPSITNGVNSSFSTITSLGGGRGGNEQPGSPLPTSGGSGGGSRGTESTGAHLGGAGTIGQGYKGGDSGSAFYLNNYPGGGGGGAGAAGANLSTSTIATAGGIGVQSSITGTPVYRAGGGGGSAQAGGTSAAGGLGGGGNAGSGTTGSFPGENGAANTGGGAGAGNTATGGNGGSGVIILRYPDTRTITIGAGLTGTTDTVSVPGFKVTIITQGTGNVSWT
jgi:hypothetical protein